MTFEEVYNELRSYNKEVKHIFIKQLLDKMEEKIRQETCYKRTNKTRVNAIKRIASKDKTRPQLTAYGVCRDYKVVTDSYHLIAIKEDVMPLPIVESELSKIGMTEKEYKEKYGDTSVVRGLYPNVENMVNFDRFIEDGEEVTLDVDDLLLFIKTHKDEIKCKDALYPIGKSVYNPVFVKNIIDVLGTNCKLYWTGEISPLYFVNENNELGLVLPIRTY